MERATAADILRLIDEAREKCGDHWTPAEEVALIFARNYISSRRDHVDWLLSNERGAWGGGG